MQINRIFLDIDGVLNLMPYQALQAALKSLVREYPLPGNYSLYTAYRSLAKWPIYYTEDLFWDSFGHEFWSTLPKSPDCDLIIDMCVQLVGQSDVFLLTKATKNSSCAAGKIDWIYKNMPHWLHRQFAITTDKEICSAHDALLIDDCDKNIEEFGGQTLLVPRPWNSKHDLCTFK